MGLKQHTEFLHLFHASDEKGHLDICTNCNNTSEKYWGFTDLAERVAGFEMKHKHCSEPKAVTRPTNA